MAYFLPQEIEIWYAIPAIRKELSKELVKKYKFSYEKTGKILGISKSAVSYYFSDKRANKINLSQNIKKEIKNSAKIISKNSEKGFDEIKRLLEKMKKNGDCCKICKKYNKNIIKYCKEKKI